MMQMQTYVATGGHRSSALAQGAEGDAVAEHPEGFGLEGFAHDKFGVSSVTKAVQDVAKTVSSIEDSLSKETGKPYLRGDISITTRSGNDRSRVDEHFGPHGLIPLRSGREERSGPQEPVQASKAIVQAEKSVTKAADSVEDVAHTIDEVEKDVDTVVHSEKEGKSFARHLRIGIACLLTPLIAFC